MSENTIRQLADNCSIQLTLTCLEALFLGPPMKVPGSKTPATTRTARVTDQQPTINALIPLLCQKVVATFNRLYPSLTILDLCSQGKVQSGHFKSGKDGACINFGLLGRCLGCQYRLKVCTLPNSRQAAIVKVMESAMATMKATAMP
jgi:hypothetical protein